MLELKNRTPFPAAIFPGLDKEGAETVTVVVKGTFGLRDKGAAPPIADAQAPVVRGDVFHGEPGKSSVKYEDDGCPAKRGTDVLLNGHAHSGKSVTSLDVELSAGPLKKTVRVTGDRAWFRGAGGWEVSSPIAFTRMPLVWERAFGGADLSDPREPAFEVRNPIGAGFSTGKNQQQIDGLRLPNLEDPAALLATPADRPAPAGFGVVGRGWQPRVKLAGTYDEKWRADRCPFLPADFDERHFNSAPAGLVSPRAFRGGEPVSVTGASATGDVKLHLPKFALEIALSIKGNVVQLAPSLDTVLIEPDEQRIVLTWRATAPCRRTFLFIDWIRVREAKPS